jgi:O-antigen/teichoic acid export membrane protein
VFGLIAAAALSASFFVGPELARGMRAFAVGVLAEQIWFYVAVSARARGELRMFAAREVFNALLHLVFTVLLVAAFALDGAYVGFMLASALSVVFGSRRIPLRARWSSERLSRLMRVGVPMSGVMIAGMVLGTVDRFIVAAYGGTTLLGTYAFAVAIAALANSGAWVIRTVIFPSVYSDAVRAGPRVAVREHVRRTLLPFAVLVPPLLGMAAIALGPVVAQFLPQYVQAVEPARIFIFTGVATGVVSLTTVAVVAVDRQHRLPAWASGSVILNVTLSLLALKAGLGLSGVAVGALLSQTLYAAGAVFIMARAGHFRSSNRVVASTLAPMAWSAAALALVQGFLPMMTVSSALNGLGLYALLLLPLLPLAKRSLRR